MLQVTSTEICENEIDCGFSSRCDPGSRKTAALQRSGEVRQILTSSQNEPRPPHPMLCTQFPPRVDLGVGRNSFGLRARPQTQRCFATSAFRPRRTPANKTLNACSKKSRKGAYSNDDLPNGMWRWFQTADDVSLRDSPGKKENKKQLRLLMWHC